MIHRCVRLGLRAIRGNVPAIPGNPFADQAAAFARARVMVACFYVALVFVFVVELEQWPRYLARTELLPLWPATWLTWLGDVTDGARAVLFATLLGPMAAALFPNHRWARVLAFVAVFQFDAMKNSYGKVGHGHSLLVFVTFALVFLPRLPAGGEAPRVVRQRYLTAWAGCQAFVMLTYTMAGVSKLLISARDAMAGGRHALEPTALSTLVADRLLETHSRTLYGDLLIDHVWLAWPLYLGTLYLEVFAIVAAFRPALHRWFGLSLLGFHVGAYLTMGITFPNNAIILGLFFILSPVVRPGTTLRHSLWSLPPLDLLRPRRRRKNVTAGAPARAPA